MHGPAGTATASHSHWYRGARLPLICTRDRTATGSGPAAPQRQKTPPDRPRQRVEAITWTLKHQPGPERHSGQIPAASAQRQQLAQPDDPRPGQPIPDRLPLPLSCPVFPVNDPERLRLGPASLPVPQVDRYG